MKLLAAGRSGPVWSAAILSCALMTGCTSGQKGAGLPEASAIRRGVTTKAAVLRRYGVPSETYYSQGRQFLVYRRLAERGTGFKIVAYGVPFLRVNHGHTGVDSLVVVIGENKVVDEVRLSESSGLADYQVLPFD